jgi:hypothetical protein
MRNKKYVLLLAAIAVFNISDACFTVNALANGATELNPLMDKLIHFQYPKLTGVFLFFALKAIAIPFVLYIIYGLLEKPYIKNIIICVFIIYFILFLYQISSVWL